MLSPPLTGGDKGEGEWQRSPLTLPSPARDCVAIRILSFRASEARQVIQSFQKRLDARFRGHDDISLNFTIATQSPREGRLEPGEKGG